MEHTKEPWMQHDDEPGAIVACHDKNMSLLTIALDGMATLYSEADARRIVQCVNACAGIADPERFINDARSYSHETVSAIVRQRDELFIALTLCQTELRRLSFKDSAIDYALERTAVAIANAKGA